MGVRKPSSFSKPPLAAKPVAKASGAVVGSTAFAFYASTRRPSASRRA